MRNNRLPPLLLVPLLIVAVSLFLISFAAVPNVHYRNLRVNNVQSLNWGGYVVASSLSTPQPSVTFVNASWIVQTANASSKSTYSSQWTGIGGFFSNDSSLIQTGTESDFFSGSAHYDAWYELLPASETVISGMTVNPGDRMYASIVPAGGANQWTITIKDLTLNEVYTTTVSYGSSQLSGEFIEERPAFCTGFICRLTTLANFGTAYYGNDYTRTAGTEFVTVGLSTAAIGSLTNQAITMVDNSGTPLATPSLLTPDGSSFSVTYGASTSTTTATTTASTTSSVGTTSTVTTTASTTSTAGTTSTVTTSTSTTSISSTTTCRQNPHGRCVGGAIQGQGL